MRVAPIPGFANALATGGNRAVMGIIARIMEQAGDRTAVLAGGAPISFARLNSDIDAAATTGGRIGLDRTGYAGLARFRFDLDGAGSRAAGPRGASGFELDVLYRLENDLAVGDRAGNTRVG